MAGQSSVRLYGKLRASPEFVGRLSDGEPDSSFGDWLDRANGFAYHERRTAWEGAYTAGAAQGFLFRPSCRSTNDLLGVIVPSQDSVGRPFPLMAVTTLRTPNIPYVPVSAHRCLLSPAFGALRDARRSGSLTQASAVVSSLQAPASSDGSDVAADFRRWEQHPLSKLWKALFPRERAEGGRRALERLRACASRALEGDVQYVRLPLGQGAGAAACFWLHALDRLLGGATRARLCVASWSLEPDGALLVALANEPPLDFWLRLWLHEPTGEEARSEPLSADLGRLVGSREARIGDLLDGLGAPLVAHSVGAC